MTLTTATTQDVQDSVQAIQSSLKTISSATDDLAEDRKKDAQTANDEFKAKMDQIRVESLQQLADSYRSTLGQLDCS